MRQDYCDITLILDKSGSMQPLTAETIKGVNGFIEKQRRQPGKCALSLILFDTNVNVPYLGRLITEAPRLDTTNYQAGGYTALLDAVGRGIDELGGRLKGMPEAERPGKVVVVIVTDGEENSSHQYKKEAVKAMIERQQALYKWEFVFLGANVDAFAEAGAMNVPMSHTLQTHSTSNSVRAAYVAVTSNATAYRAGTAKTMAWTDPQRADQDTTK